ERFVHIEEVTGSSPVIPTKQICPPFRGGFLLSGFRSVGSMPCLESIAMLAFVAAAKHSGAELYS
ncbi:MAG: hypothetical protein RR297_10005, partial [Clostridia bacterium]